MKDYHVHFECERYYHIFNRGNNGENIFKNAGNYQFFLSKWIKYIEPWSKTLAYCLMPNHFHFFIQVNEEKCFTPFSNISECKRTKIGEKESFTNPQRLSKAANNLDINQLLEDQFKKLFTSYALAFNKQQNRHGSLFEKRFKRMLVDSDSYYTKVIHYIHNNPIHHHFTNSYKEWRFSSYNSFLSDQQTLLDRTSVLKWFGGKQAFINFHNMQIDYREINNATIDMKRF